MNTQVMPQGTTEAGAPYRLPDEPAPVVVPPPPRPRTRPVLGPSLSVFAVLLWSFVVAGQFTTSWMNGAPLGPGAALMMVFLATLASWLASVRTSARVEPPRGRPAIVVRALAIFALAFAAFVVTVVMATIAGGLLGHAEFVIGFGLVMISFAAALLGPKVTAPVLPPRRHGVRVLVVVLWMAGVLLTLMAAGELLTNG